MIDSALPIVKNNACLTIIKHTLDIGGGRRRGGRYVNPKCTFSFARGLSHASHFHQSFTLQHIAEEEEEVVNEAPKKKKYSRDGENPNPWRVASLSVPKHSMQPHGQSYNEPSWEKQFFQSKEFSVKNSLFAKAVRVNFPDYLHMSNNYYEKGWGLKTHRRLKNVIVVMEFCPSKAMLQEVAASEKSFSVLQEKILRRAFAASDGKIAERVKVSELKEVLRAVDVIGDDEKEKEKFLSNMNLDPNGTVSFDELKQSKSLVFVDTRYCIKL